MIQPFLPIENLNIYIYIYSSSFGKRDNKITTSRFENMKSKSIISSKEFPFDDLDSTN